MSAPAAVTLQTYEGVGITLIILASIFVATRCFVSLHGPKHRLGIDDWCSIIGLCFIIASYAVNHVVITVTTGPVDSIDLVYLQKIAVAIIIFAQGTLWFSKAPIVFLYLKLFGVHRWLRYISWATLSVSFLVYTTGLIYALVFCPIDPSKATFPDYERCASANTLAGVFSGFVSVLVDITLLILPTPIILTLKIKISKKIGLGLTFFSAILGFVASVAALYYKWLALYGNGTHLTAAILCFTVEGTVAIMVGCAPGLKSFWASYISNPNAAGMKSSKGNLFPIPRGTIPHHIKLEGRDEFAANIRGQSSVYIRMEPC